jgi:hypothetical protein
VSEFPPSDNAPTPPPPIAGLPWEEPHAGLGSIFPTVIRFISSPIESYGRMSLTVDLVRPIAYFVGLALLGALVSQIWNFVLYDSLVKVLRTVAGPMFQKFAPFMHKPGLIQLAFGLIITPLIALIVLFVWSALVHLALTLMGGANRGFAATLRVMCYAQTSQIAVIIPGVGGLIGWRAGLAVLLVLLLCCGCIVAVAFAFGAALAQAFEQLG